MAYFDNAATTYPKPMVVYDFMDSFYRENGGNVGRGNYRIAQNSRILVAETRKKLQSLLHCPTKQIVFTPSATIALNIIIQGAILSGAKNVYITPFEHNAVTRVLHHYELNGSIHVYELPVNKDFSYNLPDTRCLFENNKPDMVVMSHASNVIGLVTPVESLCSLAKEYSAITIIDMAQTAGLVDLNGNLSLYDFLVFAGHKTLYGPTGISGFAMKPNIDLEPILYGGTGYDSTNQDMPDSLPERYEMGTLNIAGVAGLYASLEWIEKITIQRIWEKELTNRQTLLEVLSTYDFIRIVGNMPNQQYVGIVSCLIDGISSDSAGGIFSEQGISIRTGLQCAPHAHRFLQTYPAGTIRLSTSYFTTEQDFDELKRALDFIAENL